MDPPNPPEPSFVEILRRALGGPPTSFVVLPEHPEMDQPDGPLNWGDWLGARCRLEAALRHLERSGH